MSGICWSASPCPRVALEGDLCPKHTAEKAQAAFVAQWRKEHVLGVYGPWWQCPLCDRVIQSAMPEADLAANVKRHQDIVHGADWLAYQAIATADPQPAPTTGGSEST